MSYCGMPDAPMQKLIDRARKLGHWLYLPARNLWITPDELEDAQSRDEHCWMSRNWNVLDPAIRREQLARKITEAKQELIEFEKKLSPSDGEKNQ